MPCFDTLKELHDAAARHGVCSDGLEEQPALTRRLTHRLLLITPFAARCGRPSEKVADGLWVSPQDLPAYGLPKPLAAYLGAQAV